MPKSERLRKVGLLQIPLRKLLRDWKSTFSFCTISHVYGMRYKSAYRPRNFRLSQFYLNILNCFRFRFRSLMPTKVNCLAHCFVRSRLMKPFCPFHGSLNLDLRNPISPAINIDQAHLDMAARCRSTPCSSLRRKGIRHERVPGPCTIWLGSWFLRCKTRCIRTHQSKETSPRQLKKRIVITRVFLNNFVPRRGHVSYLFSSQCCLKTTLPFFPHVNIKSCF